MTIWALFSDVVWTIGAAPPAAADAISGAMQEADSQTTRGFNPFPSFDLKDIIGILFALIGAYVAFKLAWATTLLFEQSDRMLTAERRLAEIHEEIAVRDAQMQLASKQAAIAGKAFAETQSRIGTLEGLLNLVAMGAANLPDVMKAVVKSSASDSLSMQRRRLELLSDSFGDVQRSLDFFAQQGGLDDFELANNVITLRKFVRDEIGWTDADIAKAEQRLNAWKHRLLLAGKLVVLLPRAKVSRAHIWRTHDRNGWNRIATQVVSAIFVAAIILLLFHVVATR